MSEVMGMSGGEEEGTGDDEYSSPNSPCTYTNLPWALSRWITHMGSSPVARHRPKYRAKNSMLLGNRKIHKTACSMWDTVWKYCIEITATTIWLEVSQVVEMNCCLRIVPSMSCPAGRTTVPAWSQKMCIALRMSMHQPQEFTDSNWFLRRLSNATDWWHTTTAALEQC